MSKAKKKTKYAIVQDTDVVSFINKINSLIEKGYNLQGSLNTVVSVKLQNDIVYTQALTYETDKE